MAAPKDWVAWFRGHPYLEVGKPQAASVGGIEGRQLVMSVDLLPGEDYNSVWCGGGRYLALWPLPEVPCATSKGRWTGSSYSRTWAARRYSSTLVPRRASSRMSSPRVRKVLDTVEWGEE